MGTASPFGLQVPVGLSMDQAIKDMDSFQKKVAEGLTEAISTSIKLSPKHNPKIQNDLNELEKALSKTYKEARVLDAKFRDAQTTEEERKKIKSLIEINNTQLKLDTERWNKEMDFFDRWRDAQKEASKSLTEAFGKASQSFGEGLHGVFSDITTGDIPSLAAKLAKVNQEAAKKAALKGEVNTKETGKGGFSGALGGILTSIGPALLAIAALAAGIAAVVKILIDADAQAKEMNRALLDAGVAGGDLETKFGDIEETLDKTRKAFVGAFSFNRIWGTTGKDHLEILGAYQEAGFTMKELNEQMSGYADETERLQKATEAALGYSKLLGMSSKDVAGTFSTYMEELGLTLEGVQKRFSAILSVARESGFGVKRFFSMISQATSGMSLYNIRLQEAAGLLISLGKVLGEKFGAEYLNKLTAGLRGEAFDEAYRKTMMMGSVKRGGRTMALGASLGVDEAQAMAKEFGKQLKEFQDTETPEAKSFVKALQDAGLATGTGKALEDKEFVKAIYNMSQKNPAALKNLNSQLLTMNAGLGRMVTTIGKAAIGEKGTMGAGAAARAYLGPGNTLLTKAYSAFAATGKRLDEIADDDAEQVIAMEHLSGESAEDRRQTARILQDYAGRQGTITGAQKGIRGAGTSEEKASLAKAFNDQFGKSWGVWLDAAGNRFTDSFKGAGDKMGDSYDELIKATAKTKDSLDKVPEDIALARKIAMETTDMTGILRQGVEAFLVKIYDVLQDIYHILPWSKTKLTAEHGKMREDALTKFGEERSRIRADRVTIDKKIQDLKAEQAKATTAEGKVRFNTAIREEEKKKAALDYKEKSLDRARNTLLGIQNEEDMPRNVKTASELLDRTSETGAIREAGRQAVLARENVIDSETGMISHIKLSPEEEENTRTAAEDKEAARLGIRTEREMVKQGPYPEVAKMIASEIASDEDKAKLEKLTGILMDGGLGSEDALTIAKSLMNPEMSTADLSEVTSGTAKLVRASGLLPVGTMADEQSLKRLSEKAGVGAVEAHDFIVSDGRMQRIDNADDLIGFKAGGPIANASGGNQTNNISLIGAGPRDLLNGLYNAMKAGVVQPGM